MKNFDITDKADLEKLRKMAGQIEGSMASSSCHINGDGEMVVDKGLFMDMIFGLKQLAQEGK